MFDQLEHISAQLEYLTAIVDQKPSTPVSDQSSLLTTRKAAEYLGVSPKTIYNDPKRFKPVKLKGGGLRFRQTDLEELLAASNLHPN